MTTLKLSTWIKENQIHKRRPVSHEEIPPIQGHMGGPVLSYSRDRVGISLSFDANIDIALLNRVYIAFVYTAVTESYVRSKSAIFFANRFACLQCH
jgi:hypothetical protein